MIYTSNYIKSLRSNVANDLKLRLKLGFVFVYGRWKNKKRKLISATIKAASLLTNTGWKFLWRPRAVSLTIGSLLSDELVSVAAVICDSTAKGVAFASVPAVSGIGRLTAWAWLAGYVRAVPGGRILVIFLWLKVCDKNKRLKIAKNSQASKELAKVGKFWNTLAIVN